MDSITGDAETSVNASIVKGEESYSSIMDVLEKFYGKRKDAETAEKEAALSDHRRMNAKMVDFLREHVKRMAQAKAVGERWSEDTAGTKLLKAAMLSVTQESAIRGSLKSTDAMKGLKNRNPSYDGVLEQLWLLADVYAVADQQKPKKKDGERTALLTGGEYGGWANADGKKKPWQKGGKWKGKSKGKGKDGKGKSKGKGKGKLGKNRAAKHAHNTWSNGGKNNRWGGGGSWQGKGWDNGWNNSRNEDGWTDKKKHGDGICHWNAEGKVCPFGDECKYEHTKEVKPERGAKRGANGGGEGAKRRRPAVEPDDENPK